MPNPFHREATWLRGVPPAVLDDIAYVANLLAPRRWGVPAAGNCSVLLPPHAAGQPDPESSGARPKSLGLPFTSMGGRSLALTRDGCRIDDLASSPADELCLAQLSSTGDFLWVTDGPPSGELEVHLAMHGAVQETADQECAILHVHPPFLVALTHLGQKGPSLARAGVDPLEVCSPPHLAGFLGSLTPDAAGLPETMTVLPPEPPASRALARRSAETAKSYRLLVWPFHGVIVWGADLREALDLCLCVEAAAEIGIRVISGMSKGEGGTGPGC